MHSRYIAYIHAHTHTRTRTQICVYTRIPLPTQTHWSKPWTRGERPGNDPSRHVHIPSWLVGHGPFPYLSRGMWAGSVKYLQRVVSALAIARNKDSRSRPSSSTRIVVPETKPSPFGPGVAALQKNKPLCVGSSAPCLQPRT